MRITTIAAVTLLFAVAIASAAYQDLPASVPATQPIADLTRLAFRANQLFANGQYSQALPLLQRISASYADRPDLAGPLEEQIRVCQKNLLTPATQPASGRLALPPQARKPHPAIGPNEIYEVALENLGNFPYDDETGGVIPDDVKALDGKHVRISGYMQATDQADRITYFALVGSLFSCPCQFGGPPHIRHTVYVNTPQGNAIDYASDRIVVEGILHVRERKDDGYIVSLFDLDATSVKPGK